MFETEFARTIYEKKYAMELNGRKESWPETANRVAHCVMDPYMPELAGRVEKLIAEKKFIPGGRYLYAAGRPFPQTNNCFLFSVNDSRESWGQLMQKITVSLMTGGGIGVVYSNLRAEECVVKGMGGKSTGPCSLMSMVNEAGRYIMQGGSRRSAIWAGLHWWHPDVFSFIKMKDWPELVRKGKKEDFNFPARMDMTNISVILDDDFFAAISDPRWNRCYQLGRDTFTVSHRWAVQVYDMAVRGMMETGEPGFSVDIGPNSGENLRNACTEVTSRDDEDCCNLASLSMPRFSSKEEFADAVSLSTAFLLCGTLYSKLPIPGMHKVREKNRRLGLGLMGMHEWMLQRGIQYGVNDEMAKWLDAYCTSQSEAYFYADRLGVSRPVATRAVAPTGTISIVAETTSGIEPIPACAYLRRYLDGKVWKSQFVIDSTIRRLVEKYNVDPDLVEDAHRLAHDVERRIKFQAWVQKKVDHAISSTVNLSLIHI